MYKITVPTVITNGHFNREKTLFELKRSGADRVALSLDRELDYTFSSPENLELLRELITYFEDNGVETLVWLGETLGHEGIPKAMGKYTNIRYINQGETGVFCPSDESFIRDFSKWVQDDARCGAKMIMLDDDFRLSYRGKGLGCCCKNHMEALMYELREDITEQELYTKAFSGGRNKYRDAFLKVQGDSMENFAKALRTALDEVNPNARLGFCASPNTFDSDGTDPIRLARIMAGSTRPFIRTIVAPYWANKSRPLGVIAEVQRTELTFLKKHYDDTEIFTEGDTYPRPRFAVPASHLECFDTILRADGRADGILKYMLDYVSDPDYETGYVDSHVRNKPLYEKIDKAFSGKKSVGVRPYCAMKRIRGDVLDPGHVHLLNEMQDNLFYAACHYAVLNSLPVGEERGVNIIFGEDARYITEKELYRGNIIDITAARILAERGIDVGIKSFPEQESTEQAGFTDVPSEYFYDEGIYVRVSPLGTLTKVEHKDGCEILTRYDTSSYSVSGAYRYENEKFQRFIVYPFDAGVERNTLGAIGGYARRRNILRYIEWLGCADLTAYAEGNFPHLYTLVKEDEDGIAVGLWNLFDDAARDVAVCVKSDFEDDIEFINCKGHRNGERVVIDTVIYPYEFAGICVKKKKRAMPATEEEVTITPEEFRQISATVEGIRQFLRTHNSRELRVFKKYMTPEQEEAYLKALRIIWKESDHY